MEGEKVISLGCIPVISKRYNENFLQSLLTYGTHAHIYTKICREKMKDFIQTHLYYDWDVITTCYGRIFYQKLFIYQLYDSHDWKKWNNFCIDTYLNQFCKYVSPLHGPMCCYFGKSVDNILYTYQYHLKL